MRDIGKVNSTQVFSLWKNLTVCILAVVGVIVFSKLLHYYLSPIVGLLIASGLYLYVYNEKITSVRSCVVPTIAVLYSIVAYSFLTIILNLLHLWGIYDLPQEFVFFTHPFIPSLILNPISFIVFAIIYFRYKKLKICIDCRTRRNLGGRRGATGVLNSESHKQLLNFLVLSLVLTIIVWVYYQFFYIDVNINDRDSYIFTWLTVIGVFIDELYFSIRYYNLYLDLKEGDEILTPAELRNMATKTYLRFYVVCGDNMYLTEHAIDPFSDSKQEVIDTPFFTKQTMNGLRGDDVQTLITQMTGVDKGELRFFYGRKSPDDDKHILLRYFYFIDEDSCPQLDTPGEWVSFDKIKYLYSNYPQNMAELAVYDITRLATIMLTEKIFDEEGYRKSGIKSYNPTFNLNEVRKSKIDFQDDKWISISLFNSDTKLYKLKKWWRTKIQKPRKKVG